MWDWISLGVVYSTLLPILLLILLLVSCMVGVCDLLGQPTSQCSSHFSSLDLYHRQASPLACLTSQGSSVVFEILGTQDLQTVAWGCPGGRKAKIEASTTRNDWTPNTLPLVSTTAIESLALPIAPAVIRKTSRFVWRLGTYMLQQHDSKAQHSA